ncbi:MAG: metal-dependent transcriptional regulator [Clostridia bacterium]|nr:metal-dependent transcriptional regulator [Clostridia bacterium]
MHLQESGEMYLETILILSQQKNGVRAVDISEYMGYSKPSVSHAMGLLKNGGYITVADNGTILLTESGETLARKIFERHTFLTDFLIRIGVAPEIASEDACKIEHDISDESFDAITEHVKKILNQ